MAGYHQKTDPKTAAMLSRIEATSPGLVQGYFDRFGIDELPIPRKVEGNDRKYEFWRLETDIGLDQPGWSYQRTEAPADKGGYIHALTCNGVFAAERPEGRYDAEGNRIDKPANGRGRRKSE